MTIRKPITSLPDWAFRALAGAAIDTLMDRIEHEVIIMTRRGVPELVLINHEEWTVLVEAAAKRQVPT
jgi:PHD/YefM family antitoxin component YafN of YafNO toxin-antitoxin module